MKFMQIAYGWMSFANLRITAGRQSSTLCENQQSTLYMCGSRHLYAHLAFDSHSEAIALRFVGPFTLDWTWLTDWVKFIVPSAQYQLYETPILRTSGRLCLLCLKSKTQRIDWLMDWLGGGYHPVRLLVAIWDAFKDTSGLLVAPMP